MNNHDDFQDRPRGFLWPVICLALAFDLFLLFEVETEWTAASKLRQQYRATSQGLEAARQQVAASRTTETLWQGLINDVLALAETDPDLQRILSRHQIFRPQPSP